MSNITAETIFNEDTSVAPLRIIAMDSAKELGDSISSYLTRWAELSGHKPHKYLVAGFFSTTFLATVFFSADFVSADAFLTDAFLAGAFLAGAFFSIGASISDFDCAFAIMYPPNLYIKSKYCTDHREQ